MDITVQKEPGAMIVSIRGEMDHHGAKGARRELMIAAREGGTGRMIMDLSRVGFMDSSGIGLLLSVHKTVTALGGKLLLVTGEAADKLLELSGIPLLIPVYPNVEQAGRGGEQ